ncbi:hypothetical protein D9M71_573440 [compost metagenome]
MSNRPVPVVSIRIRIRPRLALNGNGRFIAASIISASIGERNGMGRARPKLAARHSAVPKLRRRAR